MVLLKQSLEPNDSEIRDDHPVTLLCHGPVEHGLEWLGGHGQEELVGPELLIFDHKGHVTQVVILLGVCKTAAPVINAPIVGFNWKREGWEVKHTHTKK